MANIIDINTLPSSAKKLIELLADYNLTVSQVDIAMRAEYPEWEDGDTRKMLDKHPLLANTANESRVIAMRVAGISKLGSFKVIAEAHSAEKEGEPDHEVRLKAADRALNLMGEKMNAPIVVAKEINIQINTPEEIDRLEKITEMMDVITQRMKVKTIDVESKRNI